MNCAVETTKLPIFRVQLPNNLADVDAAQLERKICIYVHKMNAIIDQQCS